MSISEFAIGDAVRTKRNRSIVWSVAGYIQERGKPLQLKLAVKSTKWKNPLTMTVPIDEVVPA